MPNGVDRPVDVVRVLMDQGLSLSRAHRVVEQLTSGERVHMAVEQRLISGLRDQLGPLGVSLKKVHAVAEAS